MRMRVLLMVAALVAVPVLAHAQTEDATAKRFRALAGGIFVGLPVWEINQTPACAPGTASATTCALDPTLTTLTAVSGHALTPGTIQGVTVAVTKGGLLSVGGGFVQATQESSTLFAPAAIACIGPETVQTCFGAVLMGTPGVVFPNGQQQIVLPTGTDTAPFFVANSGAVLPRAFFLSFTLGKGF